jgi:hypothetical protein
MLFNSLVILSLVIAILGLLVLLITNIKATEWQKQCESNLAQASQLREDFYKKYISGDVFLKKCVSNEPYHGLYKSLDRKLKEFNTTLENLENERKEFQDNKVKDASISGFLTELIIDPFYWQKQQQRSGKWLVSSRGSLEQKWEGIENVQKRIEQLKSDICLLCQKMSRDIKQTADLHEKLKREDLIAAAYIDAAIRKRQWVSQKFDKIPPACLSSIEPKDIPCAEIIAAYNILQELKFDCKNLLEQAEIWAAITAKISSEISKLRTLILYAEQKAKNLKIMACEKQVVAERTKLEQIVASLRGMPDHIDIERLETISRLVISIK